MLFFLLFLSGIVWADQNFLPLPLINRNDKLLQITNKNFRIINSAPDLEAAFVGEIRWERNKQNLILPFLKIRLKTTQNQRAHLHYRYKDVTYLPQIRDNEEFTDIDVSVFDPAKVDVYHEGKLVGQMAVRSTKEGLINKTILMDYSCSGYNVQVSGFDGEFLSIGCELVRETVDGKVLPSLKVYWISNEYRTLDLHPGPYVISFSEGREAHVTVMNDARERKEIHFKVNFPERLHRLKLAGGFGPYMYEHSFQDQDKSAELVPSVMLYGNYYLNNIHSLKFFEAAVVKESVFNHAGLYVGSDLGKFYDDRLVVSTLLGFQALSYRFDEDNDYFTQIIFPQGLELAFHHPFGLENYRFVLGGFLSPQRDVIYQNFWLRFGSRVFVELNYINWQYNTRAAAMYGLSVGFPLAQFL